MALENRNLIVGVTGGIAAYKAAEVCSLLQKRGASVQVAMTRSAQEFIGPLTFETITQHPVYIDVLRRDSSYRMEHISWARWADGLVIVPATANCLAKLATGLSDDPITTLALSFTGPVFVAPSMNTQMLLHPATQENLKVLESRGVRVIESESGQLACGEIGQGRLAMPERIVQVLESFNWGAPAQARTSGPTELRSARPYGAAAAAPARDQSLAGKTVLITSGPTHEPMDAVRFLSNPSSGKMGAALACEAAWRGATVHFVSGPVHEDQLPTESSTVYRVETAEEMLHAVQNMAQLTDIFIFAAAVSDFRVANPVQHKIKRTGNSISLPLIENPDISQAIGYLKTPEQLTVGFAAETQDLEDNARQKLERKNLDAIVANDIAQPETGFGSDENEVTIYVRNGDPVHLERDTKPEIARGIFDAIDSLLKRKADG